MTLFKHCKMNWKNSTKRVSISHPTNKFATLRPRHKNYNICKWRAVQCPSGSTGSAPKTWAWYNGTMKWNHNGMVYDKMITYIIIHIYIKIQYVTLVHHCQGSHSSENYHQTVKIDRYACDFYIFGSVYSNKGFIKFFSHKIYTRSLSWGRPLLALSQLK